MHFCNTFELAGFLFFPCTANSHLLVRTCCSHYYYFFFFWKIFDRLLVNFAIENNLAIWFFIKSQVWKNCYYSAEYVLHTCMYYCIFLLGVVQESEREAIRVIHRSHFRSSMVGNRRPSAYDSHMHFRFVFEQERAACGKRLFPYLAGQ